METISIINLILILIQVESSGNDLAIGDGGEAYGCLQMHSAYVRDAAEYANEDWVHEDAFDRETAMKIFAAYMARYATEKRLGRPVTAEDIARIHNGGLYGYKRSSTDPYWKKVKKLIDKHHSK